MAVVLLAVGLAVFRSAEPRLRGHDLMAAAATIEVDGLGKRYRIGQLQSGYGTLRDSLAHAGAPPARPGAQARLRGDLGAQGRLLLGRTQGEVLGIIGRNGAGKSTLLKLLTQITTPTTGQAVIRGRVGSLLEVGTGFHPELTGRENIYLNGAILGMGRREITKKLPEIVDFAGVGDVPRHAREALLERHVRATRLLGGGASRAGDPARRRGALGRRRRVPAAIASAAWRSSAAPGRTVIFVSHQMPAVARLCDRAILLDGGQIVARRPERRGRRPLPPVRVSGTPSRRVWPDLEDGARWQVRAAARGAGRRRAG